MARKCPKCGSELSAVDPAQKERMKCKTCNKVYVFKVAKNGVSDADEKPGTPAGLPAVKIPAPGIKPAAKEIERLTEAEVAAEIGAFRRDFGDCMKEVGKMIVGMNEVVEKVLISMIAGGNVLLEGVPGLGKTMLVRALSQALQINFRRVQFTPDLMPADIIGTNVVMEDDTGRRALRFQAGPIFTHLLLADEINRATPRTQSALLEALEEHSVTVGGVTHTLEEPFFVMATQNPLEQAGTYPLPAAQLDKFMFKLIVTYPTFKDLDEIIERTTSDASIELRRVTSREQILRMRQLVRRVPVAAHVEGYAARLVLASDPESPFATPLVKRYVRYGSSPRGVLALILGGKIRALLEGRFAVGCEDIRNVAAPTLRHRIARSFEGEAEEISTDKVVDDLLKHTPEFEEEAKLA